MGEATVTVLVLTQGRLDHPIETDPVHHAQAAPW